MQRDTSPDDPGLSDSEMPIRQQNALKNTFPELPQNGDKGLNMPDGTTSEEDPSQLGQLNDHLRKLAAMDKIGIRRKIVLLEGYIHKLKNNIK